MFTLELRATQTVQRKLVFLQDVQSCGLDKDTQCFRKQFWFVYIHSDKFFRLSPGFHVQDIVIKCSLHFQNLKLTQYAPWDYLQPFFM